jgi:hypothetical protein
MPIKVVEKTARKLKQVSPFKKKMMENYVNKMKREPSSKLKSMKPKISAGKTSAGEPLRKPRDPKGTGPIRPTFIKKLDALKRRKPMSS